VSREKDLVTLIVPQSEFEANLLAIVLRDHGIDAVVFASAHLGIGVPLSHGRFGVPLQVCREDVEEARQILLDNRRDSIDIAWDELGLEGDEDDRFEVTTMSITAMVAFYCAMMAALAGLTFIILQLTN
jgi:hypothetical protein